MHLEATSRSLLHHLVLGMLLLVLAAPAAHTDEVPYRGYTTIDGLPHENVLTLAQSADRRLYVGTSRGLALYDGEQFHSVSFPDSLVSRAVNDLLPRPDSTVWVSTGGRHVMQVRGQHVLRAVPVAGSVQRVLARGDTLYVFTTAAGYWTLAPGSAHPERHAYSYPIRL